MSAPNAARPNMKRLMVWLILAWSLTWLLGIGALSVVAERLSRELHQQDLDAQLSLYATAAYGLTWFDPDGTFHDDLVTVETELFGDVADLWVVQPGNPPTIHLAPNELRFELPALNAVMDTVVSQDAELFQDGLDAASKPYRLFAMPTFKDGDDERPYAAIVVIGDPTPGARVHGAFVTRLRSLAAGIGVAGILLGTALAWLSLRPAKAALERGERFLVTAAHELRNPISSLQAVCESGLAGDEPPQAALKRASQVASSTASVVEDLLLFARLDNGEVPLDLQSMRLDLLVEAGIPEDGCVALRATETVIRADPRLVRVAVRNLVENAMRHTGPSSVEISVVEQSVTVRDHGPGFPQAILSLADRPFAVAPSHEGSGLGLAICRMIAVLHGGTLELSNPAGGGAQAVLNLGDSQT